MNTFTKTASMILAGAACVATLVTVAPAATAADQPSVVSSERSFPKTAAARKDVLKEATSTDVEQDSNWGGIESLDVPKTKSQAEKDAEAKAEQERQAAAAAAASRSASRQSLSSSSSSTSASTSAKAIEAPTSSNGSGLVSYALQFQGIPYVYGGTTTAGFDCSGFTQYVFAQFGISLPRTDAQQRAWAQANGTLVSNPQPGDLMWKPGHVGIYAGNGMMVHATKPGDTVRYAPVYSSSFEYYRILK
ncbi:C40 family peptidase [Bifidobacterium saguinibicoloris]|uniref:C40 family peptidase n=1 Tax=Bifidobacterium saguinibicoloris TaxID=2834433 RepID=UPI00237C3D2E|nr:C40 family peptidase [Bifidobacterium saguinibicoloris]